MKHVLVTGATGFIGRRLTHHLLDEGYEVHVLARTPEKAREFAERGAEIIAGNLAVSTSFSSIMSEVDGVFHLAALTELGSHIADLRRVNLVGTRNILDAAVSAGVERIVYCGCTSALGDTGDEIGDETQVHDGRFHSVTEVTKQGTHKLVERRMEHGEPIINAVVSTAYGPGDEGIVGEMITHHLAGRAIAHIDRDAGLTLTHVDDIAIALRLAYENGQVGERYVIADTPATFGEFFDRLSLHTDVPAPRGELPTWLTDALPALADRLAPVTDKTTPQLHETISLFRDVHRFYSGHKARQQLDWNPRGLDRGLRDSLSWFQRRERKAANELLASTSIPLLGLTLFDIGLGISALVFPKFYVDAMHPHEGGVHLPAARSLLARTGLLWLFFALVQGTAGFDPVERPEWVLIAGALRLMDVPADIGYSLTSEDTGLLGKAGLVAAPLFNLSIGAFLAYAGYRGLRARLGD